MVKQLQRIDLDMNHVTVIDSPEKLDDLKTINIISYEKLRSLVNRKLSARITYAHRLRRRIGMILPDEGEKLANIDSDQSRALMQVSARKKFILTGTPCANYCRDMHGLMVFVGGDGTAIQPYGYRRGFLEKNWINSMAFSKRGLSAIMADYVVVEWVTWEFTETLRKGAKREIPKIANVDKYRAWLAPLLKRRLIEEPEVAEHIKPPKIVPEIIDVEWDPAHLAYYLRAADDFASWYQNEGNEKKYNLGILLARLQAVQMALNCPQSGVGDQPPYAGLTSKQREVIDKMEECVEQGRKGILFAENPITVKVIGRELKKRSIDFVPFHGGISIEKRVKAKDELFENGDVALLLATKQCAKAGYNLPMVDSVFFYDRSWSARVEDQAVRRPLRVERKDPVNVYFFHLPGSLDIYQAQVVAFKADSARAGLDYGVPELEDEEFLHLGQILDKFIADLANLRGMTTYQMRNSLKYA
jgi:hypothetical protein